MGMNRQLASSGTNQGFGPPTYPSSEERRPRGLWHAWLLLTGPGDNAPQRTLQERGRLRRARLTSVVMFGLLVLAIVVVPLGLQDPSHATLSADVALFAAVLIAAVLNRLLLPTAAGVILVAALGLATAGAVLGSKQLDLIFLPAFDLLAIVVVVAGVILVRWQMWLTAFAAIAFVIGDLALQPRTQALDSFVAQYGIYPIAARPIILILVLAILLHLLSWSLEREIVRADRAEEIAAMEHAIVEQKRQLDYGIQLILDTHVRAANGDFTARAPLTQENVLWQIAASLNNLLARLQRSGVAEHQLRRTDEEIRRLATAIRDAQQGRTPIWPAPTGTSADLLLELIGRGGHSARDPRQPPPLQAPHAPQPFPQPQMGGFTQAGGQVPDGGYSQPVPNVYPVPGAGAGSFAGGRVPASGELRWQQQQQQPQPQMPHNPWTSPDEEPS